VDVYFPEAGIAAIEFLEHCGIEVVFPQAQTCCGQPPYNSGATDEAREMARRTVELFPEPWPVVVPSGSCAAMLKHHYPTLLQGTVVADRARKLASRVVEFGEFVSQIGGLELMDAGRPTSVALHVSCSARREMGLADTHAGLLGNLSQVRCCQPERAEECCGFGGTFAVKSPDLSDAMTGDKCKRLLATGASELVSADPGCLLSLKGRLEATQSRMRARHLAEFLWERVRPTGEHES